MPRRSSRQPRRPYQPRVRPISERTPYARRYANTRRGVAANQVYIHYGTVVTPGTTVITALSPPTGYRIHLRRLKVIEETSDGGKWVEVYFGPKGDTPANIAISTAINIDVIKVADAGEGVTRTWEPEQGPSADVGSKLFARFRSAPTAGIGYLFIIETLFTR